jgi:hypothetical protein
MNKAFVREPDADARLLCPRCGSLGTAVGSGPLNTHIREDHRARFGDSAWCCSNPECVVVYFDAFEQCVVVNELRKSVYPYEPSAPICPCFGLTYDDVDQDSVAPEPIRIRELVAKSKSPEAKCQTLAIDGQCCLKEVQRLYFKLRGTGS